MGDAAIAREEPTPQVTDKRLGNRFWRLNNLYWIINEQGQRVKFRFFAVQYLLYKALWYSNIILKSRQHGVTTFFCIYFLDACLFNSNVRAGIVAHNREDAHEFFRRNVQYAYDNLPQEIRSARPDISNATGKLQFSNNSSLRVGTSLRSGNFQYIHVSELGKLCRYYPDRAEEIITGTLNTRFPGQFLTIESTAHGASGHFYRLCHQAQKLSLRKASLTPLQYKFFFFPWFEDKRNCLDPAEYPTTPIISPLVKYFAELQAKHKIFLSPAQKLWYANKWDEQGGPELMKREHPSTPAEAFEAVVKGAWFEHQLERIYRESRVTKVPWEEYIPVDTWWDLGVRDTQVIWFVQQVGNEIHVIDHYENTGEGIGHYAKVLQDKPYEYGSHLTPHDIKVRGWETGKTRIQRARKYGLHFTRVPRLAKEDQIEAARDLLGRCVFDEVKAASGFKGLENYRKIWDEEHQSYKAQPLDNWATHHADAFMSGAVAYQERTKQTSSQWTPKRDLPEHIQVRLRAAR